MAGVVQRVSAMLGKMSYNRWVLLARHEKEFGRRSSMLLTNAAFMGMLGFIVADAAQHREKTRRAGAGRLSQQRDSPLPRRFCFPSRPPVPRGRAPGSSCWCSEFDLRASAACSRALRSELCGPPPALRFSTARADRQHVNKAYLDRKTAINAKVTEDWSSERELHDLNVSELEESVFRARKGVQHSSLTVKDDSGKDVLWHKVTMVSMPLPIAELAEFAPAPRS